MDVWFDSGVSHLAVLRSGEWPELVKGGDRPPADLYVEGHDQYRGWFQSSLLTSVALFADAPFEGVVTHGFVVDGSGRKMSKSLGNVIAPQDLIKRYGADILRLWVASVDYRDDDPISEEILTRCAEAYRKMRNTARYLLSNLYDFQPAEALPYAELHPLDRRVLRQTRKVARRVAEAYESYEFHVVYHALLGFCTTTLSAFYLDVLKDRLYASPAASRETALRADRPPPDRAIACDAPGPGPAVHGGGNLGGPALPQGTIRTLGAFRGAGRPPGGFPIRPGLGQTDETSR